MIGPTISVEGLGDAIGGVESATAQVVTSAMRGATDTLKTVLRRQVTDGGLGTRLANTWRAESYPTSRDALNPSGFVWSKAPNIVEAFASGATIRPVNGHRFLWVPTRNVPRARGVGRNSSTKRMTPDQVLAEFKVHEFIIKRGKGGGKLAFIAQDRGTTARGRLRAVRRGRTAHGERGQLVLMFVLLTSVRLPKPLDPVAAAEEASADFIARASEGTAA